MKKIQAYLWLTGLLFCYQLQAQKTIKLSSPNEAIVFSFRVIKNQPLYSVTFKQKVLIDSSLMGLELDNGVFNGSPDFKNVFYSDSTVTYELVTGKSSRVVSRYKEMIIPMVEKNSPYRRINIAVRAFDDGVAFRYEFPEQKNLSSFLLYDENSSFRLKNNPIVHTLFLPSFTSSHEGYYTTIPLKEIKEDTLMDMPTLFEFPGNTFMAITEAALLDYAGMYLVKHNGILKGKLSPWPGQTKIKVKANTPHHSPWRVMMISDRIGALIESNIITSLSEPCRIKDISWIKPGKTTFPWWNGNVVPDTLNAPGNNFATNQYYIDFCSRNGLQYHSVVEYGLHQWYTDDGVGFQPGPHADVTTPVPGLDMKEICDYARQKNVDIRVWVHWAALYPKLDTAFAIFEKWGIKGMMVDFMDRDDQQMVNIQTEILEKAARHHLHIQFHGAYKPTGLNRTYPNEYTREGTLNYEADKWNPEGITPDHDINMPFTRKLAGSTDYHLGGFRAVPQEHFKTQYTRPLVLGTRCHMLAMYVVLENYLQMVCDYPAAYEGQPGFEFIKEIPTTWDETKVPDAKAGEYITIARRKGNDWYVGTITNHQTRDIVIPLNFLGNGVYTAEIYSDAADADRQPNDLVKQIKKITGKDSVTLHLAGGGGEVMRIIKE